MKPVISLVRVAFSVAVTIYQCVSFHWVLIVLLCCTRDPEIFFHMLVKQTDSVGVSAGHSEFVPTIIIGLLKPNSSET